MVAIVNVPIIFAATIRSPSSGPRMAAIRRKDNEMEWIRFIAAAICISGGVFVMISAAIGVYRFSECLTRMHAAAMGDTLGLGLIILGLIVLFGTAFVTTYKNTCQYNDCQKTDHGVDQRHIQ